MKLATQEVDAERRPDGAILLRARGPLDPYPGNLIERLRFWAARAPDRVLFAQRAVDGAWRGVTYAQAHAQARAVGEFLLRKKLSAERPLVVLSGNDIEHALLHLGAMYVGVPYAPVSPAYSLLSRDYAKLRAIFELLTPGLVYANGAQFRPAIEAVARCEVLERFEDATRFAPTGKVDAAYERVGPDTIAKFLFTSGSTGRPKAVINTQRMG